MDGRRLGRCNCTDSLRTSRKMGLLTANADCRRRRGELFGWMELALSKAKPALGGTNGHHATHGQLQLESAFSRFLGEHRGGRSLRRRIDPGAPGFGKRTWSFLHFSLGG